MTHPLHILADRVEGLLSCPFCGVEVAVHGGWLCHPNNDCLIGGSEWPDDPDIILEWQTRSTDLRAIAANQENPSA